MDVWDSNVIQKSGTTLENILDTLSAKCIYQHNNTDEFRGKVIVAAMQPNSIDQVIEKSDIVICGDRIDAQNVILDSEASLMIIAGNHKVSGEIIEKAKKLDALL